MGTRFVQTPGYPLQWPDPRGDYAKRNNHGRVRLPRPGNYELQQSSDWNICGLDGAGWVWIWVWIKIERHVESEDRGVDMTWLHVVGIPCCIALNGG